MKKRIDNRNQPNRRPHHNPSVPYQRPKRDQILQECFAAKRMPTASENREIVDERSFLTRRGYKLTSVQDEDEGFLRSLRQYLSEDVQENGSTEGSVEHTLSPKWGL